MRNDYCNKIDIDFNLINLIRGELNYEKMSSQTILHQPIRNNSNLLCK